MFRKLQNSFEYTLKGVFRQIKPLKCLNLGMWINHKSYNTLPKEKQSKVKIVADICLF